MKGGQVPGEGLCGIEEAREDKARGSPAHTALSSRVTPHLCSVNTFSLRASRYCQPGSSSHSESKVNGHFLGFYKTSHETKLWR